MPLCFQFYGGERLTLGRSLDFAIYLGIKSVYVSFTRTLADKGRTAGGLHRPQCPQLHALGSLSPRAAVRGTGRPAAVSVFLLCWEGWARCHLDAGPPVGTGGLVPALLFHRLSTSHAGCDAAARGPS